MNVIGVDLGGTKIASAIFDEKGNIIEKRLVKIEEWQGAEVSLLISQEIEALLTAADEKRILIKAVGISVPGIYYARNGHVWAPNIPGWDDYPLLQEICSMPELDECDVIIDSDRACYILGESWLGKARGCKDAIFLAVGTGIGAGIMINGRILRGANDIAGAIGWLALDRPYRDDYISCGCFEHHASGEGIAKVACELLASNNGYQGKLREIATDKLTSYHVFTAFEHHDEIAVKTLENSIQMWGMAVANLVSLFNPEKIILGGGVFGPAAKFKKRVFEEARKWAQPISITKVKLEISALGDDAGLIGAARLAMLQEK